MIKTRTQENSGEIHVSTNHRNERSETNFSGSSPVWYGEEIAYSQKQNLKQPRRTNNKSSAFSSSLLHFPDSFSGVIPDWPILTPYAIHTFSGVNVFRSFWEESGIPRCWIGAILGLEWSFPGRTRGPDLFRSWNLKWDSEFIDTENRPGEEDHWIE